MNNKPYILHVPGQGWIHVDRDRDWNITTLGYRVTLFETKYDAEKVARQVMRQFDVCNVLEVNFPVSGE